MTKIGGVTTNLSAEELANVLRALDNKEVAWVPGTSSVAIGSAGGQFDHAGSRYEINESFERIDSIFRIPANAPVGLTAVLAPLAEMQKP